MAVLFPFIFIPFCFQFMALSYIKNRLLRWFPIIVMELLLIWGMVQHKLNPPSFDIIGWRFYFWLIGSALFGSVLAWGVYALYNKAKKQ